MSTLSLEALEQLALRGRVRAGNRLEARVLHTSAPHEPWLDLTSLRSDRSRVSGLDRALGVLMTEACVDDLVHSARTAWEHAWAQHPIQVQGMPRVLRCARDHVSAFESEPARRAARDAAGIAQAQTHRDVAKAYVAAWRRAHEVLAIAPAHAGVAMGWASHDVLRMAANAVLASTHDAFRETDDWMRGQADVARRGELVWSDRQRTLAMRRTSAEFPLGDRINIALRWLSRMGLSDVADRVHEDVSPGLFRASGLHVWSASAGSVVRVVGIVPPGASGLLAWMGASGRALALGLHDPVTPAAALGVDRLHLPLAQWMARSWMCDRMFLQREASVDPGVSGVVSRECVHAVLSLIRMEAALGLYVLDVMEQSSGLVDAFRQQLHTAVDASPEPAWAIHVACELLESDVCARSLGVLLGSELFVNLREQHDEDWFRNPRAGESLRRAFSLMRFGGTLEWCAREKESLQDRIAQCASSLQSRVSEWLQRASRS